MAKTKECSKDVYTLSIRGLRVKARVTDQQKYPKQVFFVVT